VKSRRERERERERKEEGEEGNERNVITAFFFSFLSLFWTHDVSLLLLLLLLR